MLRPTLFRHPDPIRRLEADSRQFLAQQLADYASDADRNDLQLIVDASNASGAREVGEILDHQARVRLYQGR